MDHGKQSHAGPPVRQRDQPPLPVITPAAAPVAEGAGQAPGFAPCAALEARRSSLPVRHLSRHPLASTQNAHPCAMQMTKRTIGMPSRTAVLELQEDRLLVAESDGAS